MKKRLTPILLAIVLIMYGFLTFSLYNSEKTEIEELKEQNFLLIDENIHLKEYLEKEE